MLREIQSFRLLLSATRRPKTTSTILRMIQVRLPHHAAAATMPSACTPNCAATP